jgi:hypothetical protein
MIFASPAIQTHASDTPRRLSLYQYINTLLNGCPHQARLRKLEWVGERETDRDEDVKVAVPFSWVVGFPRCSDGLLVMESWR